MDLDPSKLRELIGHFNSKILTLTPTDSRGIASHQSYWKAAALADASHQGCTGVLHMLLGC